MIAWLGEIISKPNKTMSDATAGGWVYILTNKEMQGLVKVGYTTRTVSERVKELNGTGVPVPFQVATAFRFEKGVQGVESTAHQILHDKRVGKEFFRCSPEDAAKAVVDAASRECGPIAEVEPRLLSASDLRKIALRRQQEKEELERDRQRREAERVRKQEEIRKQRLRDEAEKRERLVALREKHRQTVGRICAGIGISLFVGLGAYTAISEAIYEANRPSPEARDKQERAWALKQVTDYPHRTLTPEQRRVLGLEPLPKSPVYDREGSEFQPLKPAEREALGLEPWTPDVDPEPYLPLPHIRRAKRMSQP